MQVALEPAAASSAAATMRARDASITLVRCIVTGMSPTVLRAGSYAATGSAGPCAISARTPERRRLPVMSAPTAKIAAAHQNAVV